MHRGTPAAGLAQRAGRNVVKMLGTNVSILALNFVTAVVLSRWLLPEGKGIYTLAILIPMTLANLSNVGLPQALTHYVGKDERHAPALLGGATVVAVIVGMTSIGAFLLCELFWAPAALANIPAAVKWLAVVAVPLLLWVQFAAAVLLGLDHQRAFRFVRLGESATLSLGAVAIVVVAGYGLGGAVSAWLAAQAVATVTCAVALWRTNIRPTRADWGLMRRCLRYGGAAWVGNMASFLLLRADMYLLNYYTGAEAVGHYSVAVALFTLLFTLPHSAATALLPQVTRDAPDDARIATQTMARVMTALCIGTALAAVLLVRPAVGLLFGPVYGPAIRPLLLLLPSFLLFGAGAIVNAGLQGLGRIRYYAYANTEGFAVNIALNLWWIPRWGANGAAAASTIAYLLMAAVQIVAYGRLTHTPLRALLVLQRRDLAAVAHALRRRPRTGPEADRTKASPPAGHS